MACSVGSGGGERVRGAADCTGREDKATGCEAGGTGNGGGARGSGSGGTESETAVVVVGAAPIDTCGINAEEEGWRLGTGALACGSAGTAGIATAGVAVTDACMERWPTVATAGVTVRSVGAGSGLGVAGAAEGDGTVGPGRRTVGTAKGAGPVGVGSGSDGTAGAATAGAATAGVGVRNALTRGVGTGGVVVAGASLHSADREKVTDFAADGRAALTTRGGDGAQRMLRGVAA